ncbi:class I SAM-dependent methyltransferase [Methanofollis fontis]|uniref:tRNA (guanine(37)-N(1))-methyltransferase n=1 Tax=Methanofollis fontis TaxID=2052832 RepID=A0A483CTW0_9EURY|nr:class I SAM-dependent methyltransferase family protein [Methanofollis fontis]TAJ44748.1 SAM-dependent methyltransferase [Methanofollis fontis]
MRLKDALRETIPADDLKLLNSGYTVIGDIAVIQISEPLQPFRHEIAEAICSANHAVRRVIQKRSKLEGEWRVAHLEHLVGEGSLTLHHEFGFTYRLDLAEVFFNPRLASERMRVAAEVRSGERVFIPFCGVGPFAVPAAAKGADVVGIELNPDACRWFIENIRLNRVADRVQIIRGDVRRLPLCSEGGFDRAIVPTPYGLDTCFPYCARMVRNGGTVHFYTFRTPEEIEGLTAHFRSEGYDVRSTRRCGNVAPGVSRWVFDLVKKPE